MVFLHYKAQSEQSKNKRAQLLCTRQPNETR